MAASTAQQAHDRKAQLEGYIEAAVKAGIAQCNSETPPVSSYETAITRKVLQCLMREGML